MPGAHFPRGSFNFILDETKALKLYHCMVYCSTKVKKGTLLSLKTKLQKDVAAIGICLKLIKIELFIVGRG